MYELHSPMETFNVGFARNPRRDFGIYGQGYFDAAEKLVQSSVAIQSFPDYVAYPIMFLYRHAIELDLKACIYNTALLGRLVSVPNLDHSLCNTHELPKLASKAKGITDILFAGDASLERFMAEVVLQSEYIHAIDPQSYSFRYPVTRNGDPSFPVQRTFGLESTRDRIGFLHRGLQAIHFGVDVSEPTWMEIRELFSETEF